jgi:hypothetical protein
MRLALVSVLLACGCDAWVTPGQEAAAGPPSRPPDDSGFAPPDGGAPGSPDAGEQPADAGAPPSAADAGTFDAGTTEADAGALCPAQALLCEGFDGPVLDSARWSAELVQGGTLAIDPLRTHHGSGSLHAHVPSVGDAQAYAAERQTFPLATDTVYVRAWLYVAGPAPRVHAPIVNVARSGPVYADYSGGIQDRALMTTYWIDTGEESVTGGLHALVTDAWHCVQWRFDAAAGQTDFWLDGVKDPDAHASGWPHLHFDKLELGVRLISHDAAAATFDLWWDDLVVSPGPVACE